jgi:hypothetical protein
LHRCVPVLLAGAQDAPGVGGTRPPRFSPEGKRKRGDQIPRCRSHFCRSLRPVSVSPCVPHPMSEPGAAELDLAAPQPAIPLSSPIVARLLSPGFHSHSVEAFRFGARGVSCFSGCCLLSNELSLLHGVEKDALPRRRSHPKAAIQRLDQNRDASLSRSAGRLLRLGCRLRRLLLGPIQRVVHFPRRQQMMHQHSQPSRDRH